MFFSTPCNPRFFPLNQCLDVLCTFFCTELLAPEAVKMEVLHPFEVSKNGKNNGEGIDEMKNSPSNCGMFSLAAWFVRKVIQWDKRPLYVPNFRTLDLGLLVVGLEKDRTTDWKKGGFVSSIIVPAHKK